MAWPNGNRLTTHAPGTDFAPARANAIEDRMLQIAGYRGKSIIDTEQSRASTSYGLLTTPDQVAGIVVPTDGLLYVAYRALWRRSVTSTISAAIFVGSNQLKTMVNAAAPAVQEASENDTATNYGPLRTKFHVTSGTGTPIDNPGLGGFTDTGGSASVVTTGMTASPIGIEVAAGTYTVSVQFKASTGSVFAKDRRLWVWTEAFD